MRNPREYYDLFSATYERGRDERYHALIDDLEVAITEPLCRGARVLEAGCGTGRILSRLAPMSALAVGVDLSAGMLRGAVERDLCVGQADLGALPFPDASFDVVCSFKVLAHVPHIDNAISELVRVLRPGGHLVLEFYNPLSLRYLVKRLKSPSAIASGVTDEDVSTRYDLPHKIGELLPAGVALRSLHGIRVLTPVSQLLQIPLLGPALDRLERACVNSPLRYFAGFIVAIAQRNGG